MEMQDDPAFCFGRVLREHHFDETRFDAACDGLNAAALKAKTVQIIEPETRFPNAISIGIYLLGDLEGNCIFH